MAYAITENQTLTLALNSIANNGTATSSNVDNATAKFWEVVVTLKIRTGATGTTTSGYFNVFLQRSTDGGTTWDTVGVLLGQIEATANNTPYTKSFSTFAAGALGNDWRIMVENKTGGTTDADAGDHSATYSGIVYA